MSPFEHGEVYVLDDGGEADLDLGNYERFLDLTLTSDHSMTSGKIYEQVIKRERTGHYLGKTVQMVPHVTDAIQEWISDVSCRSVDGSGCSPDICLVEPAVPLAISRARCIWRPCSSSSSRLARRMS